MKSKISLIILLVIIIFFAALSFFFGYYYFNEKGKVDELNKKIELLENAQNISEQENENLIEGGASQVVETIVEKLSIPKFDSNKVDTSIRDDIVSIREVGNITNNDVKYRVGPVEAPNITTPESTNTTSVEEIKYDYQIEYNSKGYTLSDTANIVDIRYQIYVGGLNAIILFDDGTIKYVFGSYGVTDADIEIKDYTLLKDVVGLVNLEYTTSSNIRGTCVGAITSDGVTHLLPYKI